MTPPHADRDPLGMTPGEKLAAEWEARHDARARGSHANPAAIQDYLRHARSEELASPAPAPAAVPRPRAVPPPAPRAVTPPPAVTPPRRSWLRRLAFWHR